MRTGWVQMDEPSPSTVGSTVGRAEEAVRRGDWDTALAVLADADVADRDREAALQLRGRAAYGAGELEAAVAAFEELHALHLDRAQPVAAARAAGTVAMYLMMDTGLMAPVRAWLGRADDLLERAGESTGDATAEPDDDGDPRAVRALVAMVRTYERFLCGDRDAVRDLASEAVEAGRASGFRPAVALGRVAGARVAIIDGDVDSGLAELEDVAALLLSGGLDPLTTGMVWCELICAVRGLALHDLAARWTAAMERWRREEAFGGIHGRCRVHRAEVLRIRGSTEAAEREAERACDELAPWMRREFGWPLTELGTIRLRRGDLDGAEEAFLTAHERAWDPQPGLALLRLAQGDVEAAAAMVATALDRPAKVPFKERPPFGELGRAPLLAAQVEIAVARHDEATAASANRHLDRIATTFDSPALRASARLATGRVALLRGDLDAAVAALQEAVTTWAEVGAPHEAAVARTVLGDARREGGDEVGAALEWRSACSQFDQLGSRLWLERVAARLADAGTAVNGDQSADRGAGRRPADPGSDSEVFRCDGDVREVRFAGEHVLLRDLKGMRYLERLLGEPGREFHVLDLVAAEEGTPAGQVAREDVGAVTRGGDAGPVLDDEARAAYRRRLQDIEDDLREAARHNDTERRALAERDREYLVGELARATGLGGRGRRVGSAAERARTSVTRTLRYSIERIAEHHEALADHLEQTVETGTWCAYRPDPRVPVDWVV